MDKNARMWAEIEKDNEIYYRIIRSAADDLTPVVVTMQWFDEYDYDQARFLNEHHYASKEEAQAVIDNMVDMEGFVLWIQRTRPELWAWWLAGPKRR